MVPLKKDSDAQLGVDYGYRSSDPWDGSHSLALTLQF